MSTAFDHDPAAAAEEVRASGDEPHIRRAKARQRAVERARARRDRWAARVDVLDELTVRRADALIPNPGVYDVADFFGVSASALTMLLRSHRDEFERDGWTSGQERGLDVWPDAAIVRAALLLDGTDCEVAAEIRYLLGAAPVPVVFSRSETRLTQCQKLLEKSMSVVADVHGDADPVDVWRELQQMPRYELQALTVALAALVPDDVGGLGGFLRAIAGPRRSIAAGLALLVPRRAALYARRRTSPGATLHAADSHGA